MPSTPSPCTSPLCRVAILSLFSALLFAGVSAASPAPFAEGQFAPPNLPTSLTVYPQSVQAGWRVDVRELPLLLLEEPDLTTVREEDLLRDAATYRIGVLREFDQPFSPTPEQWLPLPGGSWVWRGVIRSPGAMGLRLHFERMRLPVGAAVTLFSPDEVEHGYGPYQGLGLNGDGEFWSHTVWSDTAVVEVVMPLAPPADPATLFEITGLSHRYRFGEPAASTRELGCHLDVCNYLDQWEYNINSVAAYGYIGTSGEFFCTGSLISPGGGDFAPLFLTANHCVESQTMARSLNITWFYQKGSGCGTTPNPRNLPQTSGTYWLNGKSDRVANDFTLIFIHGQVPNGVFLSGWDAAVMPGGTEVTGIHHPSGTRKRICFGQMTTRQTYDPTDYLTIRWNQGTTEGGSSGSPVYSANQKLIGQLWGGSSDCNGGEDFYGRFSQTYPVVKCQVDGDPFEPNDSPEQAVELTTGQWSCLTVSRAREDFFYVDLPPGGTVSLQTTYTSTWGTMVVELWQNGNVLQTSRNANGREILSYTNLGAAGRFLVRMSMGTNHQLLYNLNATVERPVVTPTPLPGEVTLGFDVQASVVGKDQKLDLYYSAKNTSGESFGTDLYVGVEVNGGFYFYPTFTTWAQPATNIWLFPGLDTGMAQFDQLTLPLLHTMFPVTWYAALVRGDTGQLAGELQVVPITLW